MQPTLGLYKLTALSVEQLQRFFNQKRKGDTEHKPLSPKSLRNIYNMLHLCLDQAVINGHLLRNPLFGVKLPADTKKEIAILNQLKASIDKTITELFGKGDKR